MKKKIMVLILFVVSLSLNAADAFFAPYPASFNVNLEDPDKYYTGAIDSEKKSKPFSDSGGPGYSATTMIGLIGVYNLDEDDTVKITASMNFGEGNNWYYVSASEPYLRRPFAIDLVECYLGGPKSGRNVTRFGHGGTLQNTPVAEITPDERNKVSECWFDIILYLPNDDMSRALAADDYYCTMTINVTINDKNIDSWVYSFNGYIAEEPKVKAASLFFNILPSSSANSINIDELSKSSNGIVIGRYSFETQAFMANPLTDVNSSGGLSYSDQKNNNYYIFASSSEIFNDEKAGAFEMRLSGLESEDNLSDSYSFKYQIGLDSDYESTSNSITVNEPRITWYNGTYESANQNLMESAQRLEYVGEQHNTEDGMGNESLVFLDAGNILIKPVNTEVLDALTAGVYKSTVYFHVVSKY